MNSQMKRGKGPQFFVDEEWLTLRTEEVIEPELPIVDAHHHLWDRGCPYFVPQLLADLRCGHNFRGTVYVEAASMYRAEGDPRFASVGEVEYANGVGAAFASGYYGDTRACAGIVGRVDLTLGAFAEEVLQSCITRAPERFRGIRVMTAWDASPYVSQLRVPQPRELLLDRRFREGYAKLGPLGLTFDAFVYHPQLPELVDLADSFPETKIVVNHAGGRIAEGPYAARQREVFNEWKQSLSELAKRPNVYMKLGGLNGHLAGSDFMDRDLPPTSEELAQAWHPYLETCINSFGPERCMFESNFPPDKGGCSARALWNAFKRIAASYSEGEKRALFAGTAIEAYGLPVEIGNQSQLQRSKK